MAMVFDLKLEGFTLTGEGKKFQKELEALKNKEVHIGFQAGENTYDDGADVVDIAAFNEFGTSTSPARPFMRQSFENHEAELRSVCKSAISGISSGGAAADTLNQIGVFAKGLMQDEIVEGGFVPNAPSTIKKKGSAQPLVDTGLMRQSVNFVIKDA